LPAFVSDLTTEKNKTTYDPRRPKQETNFQDVTRILQDALALMARQDFDNALNRIGHALAAVQVALDIQLARDNDKDVESTVKVQRITPGVDLMQRLANRTLSEAMDIAQFYKANKPYKINE
jgi:hypothetical protein